MLLSKSFVFCNVFYVSVIIFRKCNMTSNLYVDVMSLLKQVITTIFYINDKNRVHYYINYNYINKLLLYYYV